MVNIEKLRVMTDIAFYRKAQKKDITQGSEYYRGDYIARRLLRNLVGYSICYAAILGLILLCSMDTLLNTFDLGVIIGLFKVYVIYYLIGLLIFEVITFCTYFYRYNRTQRAVNLYRSMLKRLIRMQGQN
jgi:hypothetical protein